MFVRFLLHLDCEIKLCVKPKLLHPSQHVSNCDSEHITLRKKKMQRQDIRTEINTGFSFTYPNSLINFKVADMNVIKEQNKQQKGKRNHRALFPDPHQNGIAQGCIISHRIQSAKPNRNLFNK